MLSTRRLHFDSTLPRLHHGKSSLKLCRAPSPLPAPSLSVITLVAPWTSGPLATPMVPPPLRLHWALPSLRLHRCPRSLRLRLSLPSPHLLLGPVSLPFRSWVFVSSDPPGSLSPLSPPQSVGLLSLAPPSFGSAMCLRPDGSVWGHSLAPSTVMSTLPARCPPLHPPPALLS